MVNETSQILAPGLAGIASATIFSAANMYLGLVAITALLYPTQLKQTELSKDDHASKKSSWQIAR